MGFINAYDPFFSIIIDGKKIDKNISDRIIKFEYEDSDEKDDILDLIIDNNDLTLIDDVSFEEGSIIEFTFGYLNRPSTSKKAKIKNVEGFKELKIKAYQIPYTQTTTKNQPNSNEGVSKPAVAKTYKVVKGDTLSKIASIYKMQWKDIYDANINVIGKNPNLISIGQILTIPSKEKTVAESLKPEQSSQSNVQQKIAGKKTRVWSKKTHSEIAAEIAKEMGLIADVTQTKTRYDSVPQSNEENIDFLRRLAKQIGFYTGISGNTLYFRQTKYDSKSQRTLIWYIDGASELEDFYPSVKTKKVSSQASKSSINPVDKNKIDSNMSKTKSTKLGDYSYVINGITGSEDKIVTPSASASNDKLNPASANSDAESDTNAKMVEVEQKWIEATCSCIGIPEITSGGIITVLGVGKKHSGNWYMKTIHHTIDSSGYHTSIDCTRNALGKPAKISDETDGPKNTDPNKNSSNSGSFIIVDGITGRETKSGNKDKSIADY